MVFGAINKIFSVSAFFFFFIIHVLKAKRRGQEGRMVDKECGGRVGRGVERKEERKEAEDFK